MSCETHTASMLRGQGGRHAYGYRRKVDTEIAQIRRIQTRQQRLLAGARSWALHLGLRIGVTNYASLQFSAMNNKPALAQPRIRGVCVCTLE